MTDDQGYGDLGCHGNPVIKTRNPDRLHAQSARLTNFHVDPTCSPTRAALMTGRYSHRTGVWHTIMGRNFLRRGEVTTANVFKASGYSPAIFGKWHLGCNHPFRPIDRGFDQWVGHGDAGTGTTSDHWGNDKMNDTYLRNGRWEKFEGFCTDIYFDEATEFIANNRDIPFFVYLATNVPHLPWNLPVKRVRPYLDKGVQEDLAYFYATIERVDYNLGRLRKFLKEQSLAENTILIFTTDNGSSCKSSFNAGTRGKKRSIYEGRHRVPRFIHWPNGGIKVGRDISRITAHIDLLPTLIEMCGLKAPGGVTFDGISLLPLLWDRASKWPDRALIVESQRIREPQKWHRCAVMTDRWRLVNGEELYEVKTDPGQKKDVAERYPEVVRKLREVSESLGPELSSRDDEFARPIIGSDKQEVTWLTGDNWIPTHGSNPWDQRRHILPGLPSNGFWPVEIAPNATYEFALRRWPKEVNQPITAGVTLTADERIVFYPARRVLHLLPSARRCL